MSECQSKPEYAYHDVDSLAKLGKLMSKLAADGWTVEIDEPAQCKDEHDDGEAWKAKALADTFRVSATRDRCTCVCESCGHTNGGKRS